MIKQNIAKLLESEMDRKDFLKTLGITLAAFIGLTAALKTISSQTALLTSNSQSTDLKGSNRQLGYGASAYGGVQTEKISVKA